MDKVVMIGCIVRHKGITKIIRGIAPLYGETPRMTAVRAARQKGIHVTIHSHEFINSEYGMLFVAISRDAF